MDYLRTQMKVAGLQWDAVFERGSDDAVFAATDGVPRLVNQLCDLTLVQAGESGRKRVGPAEVNAAWRDIQRLPATSFGHVVDRTPPLTAPVTTGNGTTGNGTTGNGTTGNGMAGNLEHDGAAAGLEGAIVEFGSFADDAAEELGDVTFAGGESLGTGMAFDDGLEDSAEDDDGAIETGPAPAWGSASAGCDHVPAATGNPWSGPEVELVFDGIEDPFAEYFADAERVVERYVVRGPDDFSDRRHVASRQGTSLSRQLPAAEHPATAPPVPPDTNAVDDADMVVIEEDLWIPPAEVDRRVIPVRLGDYRRLFARMRRGGSAE